MNHDNSNGPLVFNMFPRHQEFYHLLWKENVQDNFLKWIAKKPKHQVHNQEWLISLGGPTRLGSYFYHTFSRYKFVLIPNNNVIILHMWWQIWVMDNMMLWNGHQHALGCKDSIMSHTYPMKPLSFWKIFLEFVRIFFLITKNF